MTAHTGTTLRYDGQVIVVTGGGRGMGLAHAKLLASRGAKVAVNDLGVAAYTRMTQTMFAGGDAQRLGGTHMSRSGRDAEKEKAFVPQHSCPCGVGWPLLAMRLRPTCRAACARALRARRRG